MARLCRPFLCEKGRKGARKAKKGTAWEKKGRERASIWKKRTVDSEDGVRLGGARASTARASRARAGGARAGIIQCAGKVG